MTITPRLLQEKINTISDDIFEACQEMATIEERSGTAWLELRATCSTNAETEQKWKTTADGKRQGYLKWWIKGLQARRGAYILEYKANSGSY